MTVQPRHAARLTIAIAFAVVAAGCEPAAVTGAATGEAQGVTVTVVPPTAAVALGGQQVFAAIVTGTANTAVTWSVREGAPGGAVSTAGAYAAPAAPGTYHVVATSLADPTKGASAAVAVSAPPPPPPVAITVSPTSPAAFGCQTVAFTATVTGSTDTAVTWAVVEAGGGTVSASGLYTAPDGPGTYHVTAISHADPTRSATATVTVTTQVLSVTVDPPTITVAPGGTAQFTATVTTSCGSAVAMRTVNSNGVIY